MKMLEKKATIIEMKNVLERFMSRFDIGTKQSVNLKKGQEKLAKVEHKEKSLGKK